MPKAEDNFEWLDAGEAEQILRRKIIEKSESPDTVDLSVVGWPGSAQEYEMLATRDLEPRSSVNRYLADAQRHLDSLWVVGASRLTDEEVQQMGPYLAREESYREDAVFQILSRRRADVPTYLKPYITVKKEHILQYGLGAQAGRISLEGIQRASTAAAQNMLQPLVDPAEFEDTFLLSSDMMRRVLRVAYYILNEPTDNSALLVERFKRQVGEFGPLSPEELIARTYNFTQTQYDKHLRNHPNTLETEESLVQLLEEGRLQRLKNMANVVLVAGLGIISAGEYE